MAKLFSILFLVFITIVFAVNVVLYDFWILPPTIKPGYSIIVLLCSSFLFIGLLYLKNRLRRLEKPHVFFCIYLALTLIAIAIFYHNPAWDILFTIDSVGSYVKALHFPQYLLNHQNNVPFFSILLFLHAIVPVTDSKFPLFLYVLNAVLITLSLTLIGMKLKTVANAWGKYFFILSILFLPLILYATIPYTDTFSLIFIALSFYFFIPAPKNQKEWINLFTSFLFIALGTLIKPSAMVVMFAFGIVICLSVKKQLFIKGVTVLLPFIFFLGISWAFNYFFVYGTMKGDKAVLEKNNIPVEHYIFMGQNDKRFGVFAEEDDSAIKMLIATESEKGSIKELLLDKTEQRIEDRGFWGNVIFFTNKFSKVWGQPDFFLFQEGGDCNFQGFMSNQQCRDDAGIYKNMLIVLDILYTTIIMIVLVGSYCTIKAKDEPVFVLVCKLSLMGIAVLLLIWEARSRYLINFTPFILVLAAYYLTVLRGYVSK